MSTPHETNESSASHRASASGSAGSATVTANDQPSSAGVTQTCVRSAAGSSSAAPPSRAATSPSGSLPQTGCRVRSDLLLRNVDVGGGGHAGCKDGDRRQGGKGARGVGSAGHATTVPAARVSSLHAPAPRLMGRLRAPARQRKVELVASTLNPYLTFGGDARAAMEFYEQVFGGTLTLNTFGEYGMPDTPDADKVMHAQLETPQGFTLMGADPAPGTDADPQGRVSVSLSGDDGDELRGWWDKLADGATVPVPLEKQMWGDEFGMLIDRFGTTWMVNIAGACLCVVAPASRISRLRPPPAAGRRGRPRRAGRSGAAASGGPPR